MTGLVKAKKYDWKDSNLALFGSDTERNVKKESAMTEKAWKGAGEKVGLRIWRIVKFKVTDWPSEDYGSFYDGDSYIVLNTYKKDPNSEELDHDVHFWIGKHSTQDEYGTAAYKTVELDTYLDDKPVQHREVMDYESDRFKSYFKVMSKWKGGADSGFRRVEAKKYTPRLLHVFGEKNKVTVKEVKFKKEYLNDEDVFLIDLGLQIFQWNGDRSNKNERFEGGKYCNALRSERGGKPTVEVLDNAVTSEFPEELVDVFSDEGEAGTKRPKDKTDSGSGYEKVLFRLSDASAQMTFEEVARGKEVTKSRLQSDDVFILDSGKHCFVWIGKGASEGEKRNGFCRAHTYLQGSQNPYQPVSVVEEGKETVEFHHAF
ncbi:hypothetical protein ABFA07_022098 [Porites harrisoni]